MFIIHNECLQKVPLIFVQHFFLNAVGSTKVFAGLHHNSFKKYFLKGQIEEVILFYSASTLFYVSL